MQTIQRPYTGEADKYAIAALVRAHAAGNFHIADLPYRLNSWALDDPQNVALWVDPHGRLRAWAVMQTPWWTIDYACHPDVEPVLHRQVLAWADQRARQLIGTPYSCPAWFINTFSSQTERINDLETAGFVCQSDVGEDSWSKVWMIMGSGPAKVYSPPAGFVVRPLAGASEVETYVELHRSVFESKNMTVEWRLRTLCHPDYVPNLDLVVAVPDGTPNGRLAAFCIGWLNKRPASRPTGQIEPLGCHKDFRKYALGRVVLSECLRRLQACGAQKIHVETDNYRNTAFALYRSVGFRVIRNILVFRKDY